MPISAVFIYNEKGLKVSKTIFESGEPFFFVDKTTVDTHHADHIHLDLFMELKLNFPKNLPLTQLKSNDEFSIPTSLSCYYFINDYDLFFVYTKGKDFTINNILKDEFIAEKIAERKNKLKFFIGMIVSEFRDDIGPAPLYSKMNLEEVKFTEEQLTLLSVQGTTLLGMGQKQMPKYLIGPVPVPHSDYFFLAFSYHRLSDESSDPRIQKIGRPTVIFIMLDSVATKEKEMIDFLELFLSHWSMTEIGRQEFIDTEDFDRLFRDIRNTIYLAKDLIAVRNIQQEEFKLLFTQYSTENILLRSQNEELRNKLSHKRLNELKSSKKAPPKKKVNKKKTSKKKT